MLTGAKLIDDFLSPTTSYCGLTAVSSAHIVSLAVASPWYRGNVRNAPKRGWIALDAPLASLPSHATQMSTDTSVRFLKFAPQFSIHSGPSIAHRMSARYSTHSKISVSARGSSTSAMYRFYTRLIVCTIWNSSAIDWGYIYSGDSLHWLACVYVYNSLLDAQ